MRLAIMLARPVLPEPGIPLIAIIKREVSGVVRSFAEGQGEKLLAWSGQPRPKCRTYPRFSRVTCLVVAPWLRFVL